MINIITVFVGVLTFTVLVERGMDIGEILEINLKENGAASGASGMFALEPCRTSPTACHKR